VFRSYSATRYRVQELNWCRFGALTLSRQSTAAAAAGFLKTRPGFSALRCVACLLRKRVSEAATAAACSLALACKVVDAT
jgi:hypothetical protein